MALGVHRLLGTSSIVVRPLPELTPFSSVVSGVWVDADGALQLVLDPDGLVAETKRQRIHFDETEAIHLPILVVDDSLTTRMLEQSILESAGYDVEVASSGEEALRKAHGIGFCNITKCCTTVCPEHITITDNAIIPLKERVVDEFFDPLGKLMKVFSRREGA